MTISRLSTAHLHDSTLRTIQARQGELAELVHKASAGKRVLRPSDDPLAAAAAERAHNRLARTAAEQRALEAQRSAMTQAEAALGEAHATLQAMRDLLLGAGNGGLDQAARQALLASMTRLREQLLVSANRKDSNGLPLFRGLDSAERPVRGYDFAGQGGQTGSGDNAIPSAIDGAAAWMNVPTGNGVFVVHLNQGESAGFWTDAGTITDAAAASSAPLPITVAFSTDAKGQLQYSSDGGKTHTPYTSGQPLEIHGMRLDIKGTPKAGESLTLERSTRGDLFSAIDRMVQAIHNSGRADGSTATTLPQAIARALVELDSGMGHISSARALAGDLLRRADGIEDHLKTRELLHEGERSRAEDIDMLRALSDVETQKTNLQAALQSYAAIQRLSLVDYLGR